MNIYFLHMLFLLPAHGASLYSLGNPILIFGALLPLCLLGSMAINTLKQAVGVMQLEKVIRNSVSENPQVKISP